MNIIDLLDADDQQALGVVGSPSSSFEAIVDIKEVSETAKLLGELVCFHIKEGDNTVLVLGQITEIETKNRWHEEPSFKGIIKRYGKLPNLSGVADNRIAKINVQSSFILINNQSEAHKLANSPSTGVPVQSVTNDVMQKLMRQYTGQLVCLGKAYDTDVNVPFWFKHFGKPDEGGGGDAYHIGIFGRTGSGKTTTAANMILGYAQHSDKMSILILDPQEQFYEDNNVLPGEIKFEQEIQNKGMAYEKYKVPEQVALPDNAKLFSELLLNYGFIKYAFDILSEDKLGQMREAIERYVNARIGSSGLRIASDPDKLFSQFMEYLLNEDEKNDREPLKRVYSQRNKIQEIKDNIRDTLEYGDDAKRIWSNVSSLFSESGKAPLKAIVSKVVEQEGSTIILNISGRGALRGMDDLQTLYVKIIEDAIKEKGAELYANGEQANCLVVMDEAHRFISTYSYDQEIKELTTSIIDAVRTTRKYGIGYMFITQTIDSLHEEIRRQIRIFAFGYGLTSGSEFKKIRDTINDDTGAKFYRSFIDPSSNHKFPFMFYGPVSPLSFTGVPLFLEMNGLISDFHQSDEQSGE